MWPCNNVRSADPRDSLVIRFAWAKLFYPICQKAGWARRETNENVWWKSIQHMTQYLSSVNSPDGSLWCRWFLSVTNFPSALLGHAVLSDFARIWHCKSRVITSRSLTAIAFVVSVWPRSIYAGQFHQSFPDFCHSKIESDTQVTHTHCRQSRTRVCHWLQFKFLFWSVSVSLTKYWLCSLVHCC